AEDGIRDGHVTGVQTCALPISEARGSAWRSRSASPQRTEAAWRFSIDRRAPRFGSSSPARERRATIASDEHGHAIAARAREIGEIGRASGRERAGVMGVGGTAK